MTQRLIGAADLAPALARLVTQLGDGDAQSGVVRLLAQPRFNGLVPLLHRTAQLDHLALPPEARARCAHAYFQNAANVQRVQAEIAQIADAMAAEQVPLLVLKGSAFVFSLYSEAGVRLPGDLDLLVPLERLEDAVRVFRAQDYALVQASERHGLREMARPGRPTGKGNVDVHTHVGPWRSWTGPGYHIDMDGIWRRARPLALPGCAHPPLQMSFEDALLFVSFQAVQHGFNKFYSYFDLHAMAAGGAVDDACLAELAGAGGRGHAFRVFAYCALQVTRALLGTPVPQAWIECTRPSPLRQALIARWASPARVLAGGLPEETPDRYIYCARSTADIARMGLSAARYLTSKALRRPLQR